VKKPLKRTEENKWSRENGQRLRVMLCFKTN
jgi:hypothetical protein